VVVGGEAGDDVEGLEEEDVGKELDEREEGEGDEAGDGADDEGYGGDEEGAGVGCEVAELGMVRVFHKGEIIS
jgi:hypothetical protein